MAALELRKSIALAAPAAAVFDALTTPASLVAFWPFTSVESEGVAGGRITFRGDAGGPFTDHGVIEAFERPSRFRYRYWSDNHGTEDLPTNRMVIDYAIRPDGEGCVLEVHHANLLASERLAMMDGVWDFLLGRLKAHVEGG